MHNILLIDNFDSFTYNLLQLFEETGNCHLKVVPYDQVTEADIQSVEGFVMSPGPGIPEDFPMLQEWVAKFHQTKSILGVCLGHEAIGMTFGAHLYNLGKVFHGVAKKTLAVCQGHYFLKDVPATFDAGLYHSWTLSEDGFPPGLEVLARSEDGVIMAMAHQTQNVIGVQFHPESIMTPEGKKMVENWLKAI